MAGKKIFLLCVLSATLFAVQAQIFDYKSYPKNYFQWPVGAAVGIAANFGELRPNHYHMGLDCRTDQKENAPVYAAAAGYIAKIKIEPSGFGRAIYINHPNGLTTLYAHLNAFEPALEAWVTAQQYNLEQWRIFIDVPPNLFPVKKGEYIAASGNTGGSQGPHLHFEIRETATDKCLNPALLGMPPPDNEPPIILRLAVYDRNKSTCEQTPKFYPLKKVNGVYTITGSKMIATTSKLSFAITAYDRYTGSTNQNGIYGAALLVDEDLITKFELDHISYDETRYLNAHIDYKLRSSGGPWLQHLSPLPGNQDEVYTVTKPDGVLELNDTALYIVRIPVTDAAGNTSEIKFNLTARAGSVVPTPAVKQKFVPNFYNIFDNDRLQFYLKPGDIYDSINFIYKETAPANGAIYSLHNATIPVQNYFSVNIKAAFAVSDTHRIVMRRSYGAKDDYRKATYTNGRYSAAFREFGNFQLLVDSVAPAVTPVGFSNGINAAKLSRILFAVTDNCEEIKSFNAYLDGKWLRFTNDKGRNFIYRFDERCPPGEHVLRVVAVDGAGNATDKTYHFTR